LPLQQGLRMEGWPIQTKGWSYLPVWLMCEVQPFQIRKMTWSWEVCHFLLLQISRAFCKGTRISIWVWFHPVDEIEWYWQDREMSGRSHLQSRSNPRVDCIKVGFLPIAS
jgi:hypothetical protein